MRKEILKDSFLEITVHFLYLVIFYLIAVYFNDSSYLPTVVKAYLSDDTYKNIIIATLVTFSFIGCVCTLSILINDKINDSDVRYMNIVFKFGFDFLYFIFISLAVLASIALFVSISSSAFNLSSLGLFVFCILFCFMLRIVINTFDKRKLAGN